MNTTVQATAQTLRNVVITANDNGQLPTEIELLQTGYWDSPTHGQFYIGEEDIPRYIENFNNDVRAHSSTTGIPIDFEHKTDGGAGAWIKSLSSRTNDRGGVSIWGNIEWTTIGEAAIKGGVYKFISPEFAPRGYYDPEGRAPDTDCVLLGAGFTNRPLFKGLAYVRASERGGETLTADDNNKVEENSMTLDEIRTKAAADLSDEEKQYVADHKDELTAEERSAFGLEEQPAPTEDSVNIDEEQPVDQASGDTAPAPTDVPPVQASDKIVITADDGTKMTLTASEITELRVLAGEAKQAKEELAKKQASEKIANIAFSASDSGQKFVTDQKEAVTKLYLSMNDSQRADFEALVAGMPSVVAAGDFVSSGTNREVDSSTSAQAQSIMEKAQAIVAASDGKTTLSEAIKRVASDEPELAKEYETSMRKGN